MRAVGQAECCRLCDVTFAQRDAFESLAHFTGERKRFHLLRQLHLFLDRQGSKITHRVIEAARHEELRLRRVARDLETLRDGRDGHAREIHPGCQVLDAGKDQWVNVAHIGPKGEAGKDADEEAVAEKVFQKIALDTKAVLDLTIKQIDEYFDGLTLNV